MSQTPPGAAAPAAPASPLDATGRTAFAAVGVLSLVVFGSLVAASTHRSGGLAGGVISGAFVAVLFFCGSRRVVRWLAPKPGPVTLLQDGELATLLGPTLRELEATRIATAAKIGQRMTWRLPLGLAAAVLFWCSTQFGDKPAGLPALGFAALFGGALGWAWAAASLSSQYTKEYKTRVLPLLAGRFGQLDWRNPEKLDVKQACDEHVLPSYENWSGQDEIWGTYRGLPLSITELSLTTGSGDDKTTVFDGLLTRLDLPRHLVGVTSIIGDKGMGGRLDDLLHARGRQRVNLESSDFEKVFDVYGSDQVAARALLTPAFMERLATLGARAGFCNPTVLAVDNHLTIALPKAGARDLFEPPDYNKPAASLEAVTQLSDDLAAVLRAADAVIDLDPFSRAVAAGAA